MHKDILSTYPEGVEALGRSAVCDVQGMIVPRKLMTLQGHPEFGEDIMLQLLEAHDESEDEDDKLYHDAMSRVGLKHDGTLVAQAFIRFLLDL